MFTQIICPQIFLYFFYLMKRLMILLNKFKRYLARIFIDKKNCGLKLFAALFCGQMEKRLRNTGIEPPRYSCLTTRSLGLEFIKNCFMSVIFVAPVILVSYTFCNNSKNSLQRTFVSFTLYLTFNN